MTPPGHGHGHSWARLLPPAKLVLEALGVVPGSLAWGTAGCTKRGLCAAKDGICIVASDADCRASEDCKKHPRRCTAEGLRCE